MQSATTPNRADLKISASGSVFIATMAPEFPHPDKCWAAPEIPNAIYSFGATVLPDNPTCQEAGHQLRSQATRLAPAAPPNKLASSSSSLNCVGPPRPLPPETTMSAVSSLMPEWLFSFFSVTRVRTSEQITLVVRSSTSILVLCFGGRGSKALSLIVAILGSVSKETTYRALPP